LSARLNGKSIDPVKVIFVAAFIALLFLGRKLSSFKMIEPNGVHASRMLLSRVMHKKTGACAPVF
jgi:hypothetical protein